MNPILFEECGHDSFKILKVSEGEVRDMLKLIPCPRCRKLCPPYIEACESCGCPVRRVTERQQKRVKIVVAVILLIFLLLLANSIYWATKL